MVALAGTALRAASPDTASSSFAADVLTGLQSSPKCLPPKYFYDNAGSRLFEKITQLPEYYPTRCELEILRANAKRIAKLLPQGTCLIEFGSGSTAKIRVLLGAAAKVRAYVPVDISAQMLEQEAAALRRAFPHLAVLPIAADFTKPFDLPAEAAGLARAGFFPGSTIGNFEPQEAAPFLRHVGMILGPDAILIVGIDLVKEPAVLHAAYNDAAGVTAHFNLNLLRRINRELGADFDLNAFEHDAFYNAERQRIEMHLVSRERQRVTVCGKSIEFLRGETIHTENSYKYTTASFGALTRRTGWLPVAAWTDPDGYFSVQALKHRPLGRHDPQ